LWLFVFALCGHLQSTNAQTHYTEYELKAGYLINFAKFISWPTTPKEVIIGVLGPDPFGNILEEMTNTTAIGDKKWSIEHYKNTSEIKNCHILFVSKSYTGSIIGVTAFTKDKAILTVGDEINGFCQKSGVVNFLPKGENKLFEINLEVASKNCLRINIELLRLASVVGDKIGNNSPCNH
jgi:hypothetical protein